MKSGPKRKSAALKKLAGNPGGRDLADAEQPFEVPESTPYAPRHLSDEAQKQWRQLAGMLVRAGVYTEADGMALAALCEVWATWVRAKEKVDETGGPVLVSDKGNYYQNPWVHERNKALDMLIKMVGHFGLSPAERPRIEPAVIVKQLSLSEELFQAVERRKND